MKIRQKYSANKTDFMISQCDNTIFGTLIWKKHSELLYPVSIGLQKLKRQCPKRHLLLIVKYYVGHIWLLN